MVTFFIKIFSYVYTYSIHVRFRSFMYKCRTIWLSSFLKTVGDRTIIKTTYIVNPKYISIGNNCRIGRRTILASQSCSKYMGLICIADNVEIGDDNNISSLNGILIDEGVLTGRRVMINDTSHGEITKESMQMSPNNRPITSKGGIHICRNVWIGEMACILSGVTIGEGAIIAANAVVTKNVPPFSVVAGVPARVIKSM